MLRMPRELGSDLPSGLCFSCDTEPGYVRRRFGKGFCYYCPDGSKLSDQEDLKRIRSLAIPPAYRDVWICTRPEGHLQATGYDDRRRKQYRYHPLFQEFQNALKFSRMEGFARRLPKIRQAVREGIRRRKLDREKVLATAVYVLDSTGIRVGSPKYTEANSSYGLTTLQDDHVEFDRSEVKFSFRGKSGKERKLSIRHPTVSRIIRNCQELPGEDLLVYQDENGGVHRITSGDINAYLRSISGAEVFAKDFRTWLGSLSAMEYLLESLPTEDKPLKKTAVEAIKFASRVLGNTPATARKYYVNPIIIDTYLSGGLGQYQPIQSDPTGIYPAELKPLEKALLKLVRQTALQ